MLTARTTWSMLVAIEGDTPVGAARAGAYSRPTVALPHLLPAALSALDIRPNRSAVAVAPPPRRCAAARCGMRRRAWAPSGSAAAGTRAEAAPSPCRSMPCGRGSLPALDGVTGGTADRSAGDGSSRLARRTRVPAIAYRHVGGLERGDLGRVAGIRILPSGASSSPNSSGTGEFPFGTDRGDAAPGGVATVPLIDEFDHDYPFTTN